MEEYHLGPNIMNMPSCNTYMISFNITMFLLLPKLEGGKGFSHTRIAKIPRRFEYETINMQINKFFTKLDLVDMFNMYNTY